mgnify:CR=1 FL=1
MYLGTQAMAQSRSMPSWRDVRTRWARHKLRTTGEATRPLASLGPSGTKQLTCFVPCWNDDGTDDGQGFHSGYDGDPSCESAGCTRLFYNDARYIYDDMPDGTSVIVY